MRQKDKQRIRVGRLILLGMVLALVLGPSPTGAVDKYLAGGVVGIYYWTTAAHWNPVGVPAAGDNVFLNKHDGVSTRVYYYSKPATVDLLYLNIANTSTGSVDFYHGYWSDPTSKVSAQREYIGNFGGKGSYNQYAGINSCDQMSLGSLGTYNFQGGTIQANQLNLNGGGVFNQTGGSFFGTFNQSGGTVKGALNFNGTFNYNSGAFEGRLVTNGKMYFNADFTAGNGMENNWGNTLPNGKNFTFNGQGLTNNSLLNFNTNFIWGNGPIVNNGHLHGGALFDGTGAFTNNGVYDFPMLRLANNAVNFNYGAMKLQYNYDDPSQSNRLAIRSGSSLINHGTISMNDDNALIYGGGALTNEVGGVMGAEGVIGLASGKFQNKGFFAITEGNCSVLNGFTNTGTVFLEKGALLGGTVVNETNGTMYSTIGAVSNNITNKGTIEAKGGPFFLHGAVTNTASGKLLVTGPESQLKISRGLANNLGKILLTGGDFDNNSNALENNGQIAGFGNVRTSSLVNKGTMTFTGGNSMVVGTVTNNATGIISLYHTTMFTDKVTNYGIVNTFGVGTSSNPLVFAGGYDEYGTFNSDPAVQVFSTVNVAASGYFTSGPKIDGVGDRFVIEGDFFNQSTKNLLWQTLEAELAFVAGEDNRHQMYLPGADRGASRQGWRNNFAWGSLIISGQSLELQDGNHTPGGALYAGEILGADLRGNQVANIFGHGLNLYYDPLLASNDYLRGLQYTLQDGGLLTPMAAVAATPLPGSLILVLSGLLGLAVCGRRALPGQKK